MGGDLFDDFTVKLDNQTQNTMRAGVLGPHVYRHNLFASH
jgi:hypothetical protein